MLDLYRRYTAHNRHLLDATPEGIDLYKTLMATRVRPGDRLLHVGCGWDRSHTAAPWLDTCQVVGVDLDRASQDGYPSHFWLADASRLPFADASFDLAFSEYVMEHVEDPEALLREVRRVLRPGGRFVILTPNLLSYKSLGAAALPHTAHEWAARHLRLDPRESKDVFPTLYRLNTRGALERTANRAGLQIERVARVSNGPTWFARVPGLFEAGRLLHWGMDHLAPLEPLRCSLVALLKRPGDAPRRDPLAVRCLACGHEDPSPLPAGPWRCDACGHTYPGDGRAFEALP